MMRDSDLVPWSYPEYLAMLSHTTPRDEEWYYDVDYGEDERDYCPRCGGGSGCRYCLMTEW